MLLSKATYNQYICGVRHVDSWRRRGIKGIEPPTLRLVDDPLCPLGYCRPFIYKIFIHYIFIKTIYLYTHSILQDSTET